MAAKTVTIDETYFKTLLRRAELHGADHIDEQAYIRILRSLHNELLKDSREYHLLRQTLLEGGVSPQTLDLLLHNAYLGHDSFMINNERSASNEDWAADEQGWRDVRTGRPPSLGLATTGVFDMQLKAATVHQGLKDGVQGRGASQTNPDLASKWSGRRIADGEAASPDEEGMGLQSNTWNAQPQRKGPRNDNTLLFKNLPENTLHKDITSVVRGGRLVDIWLRKNERAVAVTFAEGAAEFLAWSKRNGININGRRIEVGWSERQFTINSQLASKLSNGHSRNLVVRGAAGRLAESQIREDMEHIHNMVISACVWQGVDIYISTNSIDKATFARNCMLSRLAYKGLKIEWYPDECAEPLPKHSIRPSPPTRTSVPTTKAQPVANRFDLLSFNDDDADSSGGSEGDESSRLSGIPLARSINASTVAA